jgi:hypothetical protein
MPEHVREISRRHYAKNRDTIINKQREEAAKISALVKTYRNLVGHDRTEKFDRRTYRAIAKALEKQLMENTDDLR